jgi:hypothetical protein
MGVGLASEPVLTFWRGDSAWIVQPVAECLYWLQSTGSFVCADAINLPGVQSIVSFLPFQGDTLLVLTWSVAALVNTLVTAGCSRCLHIKLRLYTEVQTNLHIFNDFPSSEFYYSYSQTAKTGSSRIRQDMQTTPHPMRRHILARHSCFCCIS